jgi:hypothetical protein
MSGCAAKAQNPDGFIGSTGWYRPGLAVAVPLQTRGFYREQFNRQSQPRSCTATASDADVTACFFPFECERKARISAAILIRRVPLPRGGVSWTWTRCRRRISASWLREHLEAGAGCYPTGTGALLLPSSAKDRSAIQGSIRGRIVDRRRATVPAAARLEGNETNPGGPRHDCPALNGRQETWSA